MTLSVQLCCVAVRDINPTLCNFSRARFTLTIMVSKTVDCYRTSFGKSYCYRPPFRSHRHLLSRTSATTSTRREDFTNPLSSVISPSRPPPAVYVLAIHYALLFLAGLSTNTCVHDTRRLRDVLYELYLPHPTPARLRSR